jgi:hypothetical protein
LRVTSIFFAQKGRRFESGCGTGSRMV